MFGKIALAGALLLAMGSTPLQASPLPDYPFIHTRGSAVQHVVPDRGTLDFEIMARDPDAARAQDIVERRIDAVRALLAEVGLAEGDVEIRAVRKEMRAGAGAAEAPIYELRCDVRLRVDDLSKWGALTAPLTAMANVDGFSTAFSSSRREAIETELVNEAIQAALRRGQLVATGFGRKLGPVAGVTPGELKFLGGAMALAETANRFMPPDKSRQVKGATNLGAVDLITMMQSVDVVFRIAK
jgi:uncharacterized protein